ncbi:hypothetical protein GQ54DRAFT_127995 [Martensiomyces pterosporus]|nr:hypothetical protein GQ54DRAFT_127995 [Martensiomyces pterosporus]
MPVRYRPSSSCRMGREHHCALYRLASILAMLAFGTRSARAEIIIAGGQHRFKSYMLLQQGGSAQPGNVQAEYMAVRLEFQQNCQPDMNALSRNVTHADLSGAAPLVALVVPWNDAASAGCFTYAQIAQSLVGSQAAKELRVRGVIFGSSIDGDQNEIGSPLAEPYGDFKSVDADELDHFLLVQKSTAHLLCSAPTANMTVQIVDDPGPWNRLLDTAGFKAQKYSFMAISIGFILYTFWEIGLMLCTQTVWNKRMLMYVSAIGYLIVFTLLQPYSVNNRASQIVIYVSWILGYISFTLFIVAWGTMVEKIHHQMRSLRLHRFVHYGSAGLVSLTMLLQVWGFAAESHPLATTAGMVVLYEMPVVFGVQTALLGFLVWAFLRRTFEIAISLYTKSVLRNVSILCVVALVGCLCIVAFSITLTTPARCSTQGYMAVVVLYQLGQCLLFFAIFAAFWVRDHAKRTRPLFHQHEFYAEVERRSALQPAVPGSPDMVLGRSRVEDGHGMLVSFEMLERVRQRRDYDSSAVVPVFDADARSSRRSSLGESSVVSVVSLRPVSPIATATPSPPAPPLPSMASREPSPPPPLPPHHLSWTVARKPGQRRVYVSLEPATVRQMRNNSNSSSS